MGLIRLAHRFLVRQTMPATAVEYYDRMLDAVEDFYLRPFCERVRRAFPGSASILDIGTGAGHLPVMLARANKQYQLTGIDLSSPILDAARERARRSGVQDRVKFLHGDVSSLPLAPESFDLVISTCSLHHWRWPVRILQASGRVAKKGGQIWLIDDRAGVSRKERQEWIRRVEDAMGQRLRLFRFVHTLESRFLSYSRREIERLGLRAGMDLLEYAEVEVFLIAKFAVP